MEAELKGIKLFIKHGERDFSTGMLGHAKLLSHKVEGGKKRRIGIFHPLSNNLSKGGSSFPS